MLMLTQFLFDQNKSLKYDSSSSSEIIMDAPTIQPKFLKKGNELGIVAVGFSGGQVSRNQRRVYGIV